jgi:hypothetical protein
MAIVKSKDEEIVKAMAIVKSDVSQKKKELDDVIKRLSQVRIRHDKEMEMDKVF